MSNSGKFSGILESDSPQLLSLIRRYLPSAFESLAERYSQAWRNGLCEEGEINREEGVSFNPRPARLATLLLSDGSVRDQRLIEEALLLEAYDSNNSLLAMVADIDLLRHLHMSTFADEECQEIVQVVSDRASAYTPQLNARLFEIFQGTLDRCQRKYL